MNRSYRVFWTATFQILAKTCSQMCSLASISLLLSLITFLMVTNTLLDNISTYAVLDFLQTKAALAVKAGESWKSATCLPSQNFWVSSIYY